MALLLLVSAGVTWALAVSKTMGSSGAALAGLRAIWTARYLERATYTSVPLLVSSTVLGLSTRRALWVRFQWSQQIGKLVAIHNRSIYLCV
jgi:hypothetical protein